MIGKKLVALVFSPTGSTLKIVRRFSRHFEDSEIIDLTTGKSALDLEFDDETMVLFAFPVYAGRVPDVYFDRLEDVYGDENDAIIVGVYGNRHYDDALFEMYEMLSERDFNVIAAAAFVAEHTYSSKIAGGRPDEADLEMVDAFVDILQLLPPDDIPPKIPGDYPYREGVGVSTWAPYPSDGCISCGVCSMVCPVGIINPDGELPKERIIDCLHCMACVKRCPTNVRFADDEALLKLRAHLEENFAEPRKEPEIFL